MSQLDIWLFDSFKLSRADLIINIERLAQNASRYSKENTLPQRDEDAEDFLLDPDAAIEAFVDNWCAEHERCADEDEKGEYRSGENMQIANAIAESRMVLQRLGSTAPLSAFPFQQISVDVRPFFRRALQKEFSSSLRKLGKITLFQGGVIYADDELEGLLDFEFEQD